MITDSHTHIYDEEKYKSYLKRAKGMISKIIVMHWPKFDLEKLLNFTTAKNNLYVVGSIDTEKEIKEQLEVHERLFKEKRIFGIKIYPGYQYFYPSDEKVYAIAELCQKYNKPLIIHSGDVYNPDKTALLKYSHPLYIDELAGKFPNCKIIISHFGFPYYMETANIVSKNKNVYTDISGTIDKQNTKKKEKAIFNQYMRDIERVFAYFPSIKEKIMFGTDYGGEDTPLCEVSPYIKIVNAVFSRKDQDVVLHKLVEKLFFTD